MFEHSSDLVIPFEGDLDTLCHAVLERGIFVKTADGFSHRPSPGVEASFDQFLVAYKHVASAAAKLTPQEFLGSRPSRLRKVYELAQRRNRSDWFDLDKEAITSGFVKVEKTKQPCGSVFGRGFSKAPVPRLINPRSPRYNAMLGCYTIACEHTIYDNIGELFGRKCIAKGMNMADRAEVLWGHWSQMSDPVCVGMDASRFDQHTGKLPLELEHAVLRAHFPGDKTLKWLQKVQLANVMYGRVPDGLVKAYLKDMRMSGDMNTALGNCVITAAMLWMRLQLLGIHAFALVDGDDSVLVMERRDYERYANGAGEFFAQFGYTMVIEEPVDVFEQIIFCQTQPIWVGDHWRMVRDPRKALNNDYSGYQKCSSPEYVRSLFHSIGSAGLSLCSGVPVMQSFYEWGLRSGTSSRRDKLMEMQLHGWHHLARLEGKKKAVPVHPDSRESFYRAFGILPATQVALEEHFNTLEFSFTVQQAPGANQEILSYTALPIAEDT